MDPVEQIVILGFFFEPLFDKGRRIINKDVVRADGNDVEFAGRDRPAFGPKIARCPASYGS